MESVIPATTGEHATGSDTSATAPNSDSQRVLSNSLVVLVRQLFLWGLNSILVLFLPRYLGAEGMGQLSFMLSFTALVAVGITLGFGKFITKAVARDTSMAEQYFGAAMALRVLLTILGVAVTVVIVEVVGYEPDLKTVLYVGTASMIAASFAKSAIGFLWGFEDMKSPARAEISAKTLGVAAGIPVLILTSSVIAYVTVLLVANLLQFALASYYLQKRVKLRITFNVATMRNIVAGGIPFLMMVVILEMYANADVIILRAYTTDAVTGWYGAALQFYQSAQLFPLAITTALLPTLSRLHKKDVTVLAGIARKSISINAAVVVPASLALSLLSQQIIDILPYPAEFDNSVLTLSLLALTIPITAFLSMLGTIAISVDKQKAMAWALAGTLLLDIALNMITIPYFQDRYGNGGIGAGITTLLAEVVMVIIAVKLMPAELFDRATRIMVGKILVAAAVLTGIGLLSYPLGVNPIFTVVAGCAVYVGLIFAMKIYTVKEVKTLLYTVMGRRRAAELDSEMGVQK